MKNFCTLEDLKNFCKTNDFSHFNFKEHNNKPLIVQSIEIFEANDEVQDGFLPVKLKACHIDKNRNGSSISEDSMKDHMATFKGRPILGAIYKTDTGEYEFHAHDVQLVEDDDELNIEYIEQPIGAISEIEEPYLEYDENEDKTYLMVSGKIYEDYSHAVDIFKRRRTCKCSVEIAVFDLSWDGKSESLSINDFSFRGVTVLGFEQDGVTEIEEGMEGSKITIDNFSAEQNSMFGTNYQEKLIETLDQLNTILSKFSIENAAKKGVEEDMNHFEELLEAYGVTREDVDFEVDGLTDEELDSAFEEHFKCKKKKCDKEENFEDGSGDDAGTETGEGTGTGAGGETGGGSTQDAPASPSQEEIDADAARSDDGAGKKQETYVLKYELSHADIRIGLYNLLDALSDDDYCCFWIAEVYDDKFIYEDWTDGKFYRQGYSKDGDELYFVGEKVEVFNEWLSKEERDALDALKKDYTALKQFKETYDANELKAQKDEIFNREQFTVLVEDEAFIALKSDMDKFTVEEIESKAKEIFADFVIAGGTFAARPTKKSVSKVGIVNPNATKKKKAYGNLFDD